MSLYFCVALLMYLFVLFVACLTEFVNCDDVCMCVVNNQFELLEFVIDSVYVDLHYDEISLTFTAGSVSLCCVCEVVVVPYVDELVDVTVMCLLLFVLHVCLLRDCDGVRLTAMLVKGYIYLGTGKQTHVQGNTII